MISLNDSYKFGTGKTFTMMGSNHTGTNTSLVGGKGLYMYMFMT